MDNDWHSALWWRKRPQPERLSNLHLPPRIEVPHLQAQGPWNPESSYIVSGEAAHDEAARMAANFVTFNELSGRWIDADDYIEMLKDSFGAEDGLLPEMYSSPHLIKYLKGVFDVVVLADLGEERKTEFATHELGNLIRKRHARMLTTIITTRLTYADLLARYGDRVAPALTEFEVIYVQR